jgi:hypothetical protein
LAFSKIQPPFTHNPWWLRRASAGDTKRAFISYRAVPFSNPDTNFIGPGHLKLLFVESPNTTIRESAELVCGPSATMGWSTIIQIFFIRTFIPSIRPPIYSMKMV